MKERIVLAYSGGMGSSVAISGLAERHDADIVAVTLDLGQGDEIDELRDRALTLGASRAHVLDAREEFASGYVLPLLQAGVGITSNPRMPALLAEPIVAKALVEIASIERVDAVAHGYPINDRFDALIAGLRPGLRTIPFASAQDMPVITSNICGRTAVEAFALTRAAADAPDRAADVELSFTSGVPTSINGVALTVVELIESLTLIAGGHGIGRIPGVDASQPAVYEAPAVVVLRAAYEQLTSSILSVDEKDLRSGLAAAFTDVLHQGLWFTPAREPLDALNARLRRDITGTVRVQLLKGECTIVGTSTEPVAPATHAPHA